MRVLFFFLQFDWEKLRPEHLFGGQVLERTPAGLSIIYLIGIAILIVFLSLSFSKANLGRRKLLKNESERETIKMAIPIR